MFYFCRSKQSKRLFYPLDLSSKTYVRWLHFVQFCNHLRWGCVFIFTPKPERPNHISCSTHKFSVFFSSTPCSTTLKNTNQNSTSHYTKNDKIYSKNLPHQLQIKYFYELNKNLTKIHNHITPVSQQLSL